MNLTGRPPYQKGQLKKKRRKGPTAPQKERREIIRTFGCILRHLGVPHACSGTVTIHHCGTGGGGRKDEDKIVPICEGAHTGYFGIDGRGEYSKRTWQENHVTEEVMLAAVDKLLRRYG